MNNKMEEKQKIERVLAVFSQYLKDTDFYEVFWSERHGYILLGMSGDGTNVFDEASIISTSEAFVKRMLTEISFLRIGRSRKRFADSVTPYIIFHLYVHRHTYTPLRGSHSVLSPFH